MKITDEQAEFLAKLQEELDSIGDTISRDAHAYASYEGFALSESGITFKYTYRHCSSCSDEHETLFESWTAFNDGTIIERFKQRQYERDVKNAQEQLELAKSQEAAERSQLETLQKKYANQ